MQIVSHAQQATAGQKLKPRHWKPVSQRNNGGEKDPDAENDWKPSRSTAGQQTANLESRFLSSESSRYSRRWLRQLSHRFLRCRETRPQCSSAISLAEQSLHFALIFQLLRLPGLFCMLVVPLLGVEFLFTRN